MGICREYNIVKYLTSMRGVETMLLEAIIQKDIYVEPKRYELQPLVAEYLKYIDASPFYVAPSFNAVKTDSRLSTLNPKFLLFSAPGAVGKSALAKYISYKYSALYWDLAKIKLGTNSFAGSILSAVTAPSYSSFISDLNSGNVLLAIDALDEAEVVSGRKMIGNFILDISNSLANYSGANIMFFARTETAQFIATFCAENEIPLAHYEIGFFLENQSKEFMKKSISDHPTQADLDCIEKYYSVIEKHISNEERQSFLGYAPVLEAMSSHIKDTPNRAKMISTLSEQTNCTEIIMAIMKDLLSREQTQKVSVMFHEKCKEAHTEFCDWEMVYSPEEQMVRVIYYVIFGDTSYRNYELSFLPPQLINEYQETLDMFLPQHPFIGHHFLHDTGGKNVIDFAGPAFRDYTLAQIILNDKLSDLAHIYFEESKSQYYFPSQIFFDCYTHIAQGKVYSDHIAYIYDSYRAKATAMERPYLQCSEVSSDGGGGSLNAVALFGMLSNKQVNSRLDMTFPLAISGKRISFEQLSNVSVDMPNIEIYVGHKNSETRISNSSIICKRLIFGARNITIESFPPEGTLIVSEDLLGDAVCEIDVIANSSLRISTTNIKDYYRLIPYEYNFEDTADIDITKFTYAMRSIMIEFRTHKKDTLAKDAERIENVTVGSSTLKSKVLQYMKERQIIYRAAHLYKIDIGKMQSLGISYSALARLNTEQMSRSYSDFCTWGR